MTQSDWVSNFQVQQVLKTLGCVITPNNDGQHVDVYNPKSEKVITIGINGSLPPFKISMMLTTLGLKN